LYKLIQDLDHAIFSEQEGPFISIYLNTHAATSDVEKDIITFKNLIKTVKESLKVSYDQTYYEALLEPLENLLNDKPFWHHNQQALAIFSSTNHTAVMRLTKAVNEQAIVADSLHIKPLYRAMQSSHAYHVLAIDKAHFNLYSCQNGTCHKVKLDKNIQSTKEALLGTLEEEGYLSHASYDGASNMAMYHGHEDVKAIEKIDLERFFSYCDDVITKLYSRPTKRPLLLWALPEQASLFKKQSNNPYLLEEMVTQSTKDINEKAIINQTWPIIKNYFDKEVKAIIERFKQAHANGLASDNIHEIGKKIVESNIEIAFIQSDATLPGKMNEVDGTIIERNLSSPYVDDVLDDMAERIIKQGGKVYVLDEKDMPVDKKIAAIFRY
jgi:hypothetical protein